MSKKILSSSYNLVREFALPLILGITFALIWANTDMEGYQAMLDTHLFNFFGLSLNLKEVINDIFMTFFFGLASKEIYESFLPGGCLNKPKMAINPILATIGGVVIPSLTFIGLTLTLNRPEFLGGMAIPVATDIAFAWLGARLIFGQSHPAIQFLLLLAVIDDAIGMMILAIFFPTQALVLPWLSLTIFAMLGAYLLKRAHIQQWWIYVLGPGVMSWLGFALAGLHPALALTCIVPFMPFTKKDFGLFENPNTCEINQPACLQNFEHQIKPFIDFGLFFFGLVNAGIAINSSSFGALTLILACSLILGKFMGVTGVAFAAQKIGIHPPAGVKTKHLPVIGFLAGVDITVSLFLADRIYTGTAFESQAKLGVLLSLAVPASVVVYKLVTVLSSKLAHSKPKDLQYSPNKHLVH
jgi:NhaA family Na+:H+ antiporter